MVGTEGFWKIGLIPQAIANGLATILVLFFLLTGLHGSLLDVGLVTGVSALALIPSQMVWGKLIDGAGKCKPFLTVGFVGMGLSFAAIPFAGTVGALLFLVAAKSVMYAATLPARQLLTVESERKEGWKRGLANMQAVSATGETLGMGIGTAFLVIVGYSQLFYLCGGLCIVSALALGILAKEPGFMIQRKLVAMERSTALLVAMSDAVGGQGYVKTAAYGRAMRMMNSSTTFLLLGIFCFSLAGSAFYSPLPAYFLQFFSSSLTFFVFFAGSLSGAIFYFLVGRTGQGAARSLIVSTGTRVVAIPALLLVAVGASPGFAAAVGLMVLLEAVWSFFDVNSTFAYLERAQIGRAGYYGGLVGLGSAGGAFFGGYVSNLLGFPVLFLCCGVLCAVSFVSFAVHYSGAD